MKINGTELDPFFETTHPDLTGLGARLRVLRYQARLTQAELAAKAGLHRGTVADIERGRRTNVWFSTARRLVSALGLMSGRELLCDSSHGVASDGGKSSPKLAQSNPPLCTALMYPERSDEV